MAQGIGNSVSLNVFRELVAPKVNPPLDDQRVVFADPKGNASEISLSNDSMKPEQNRKIRHALLDAFKTANAPQKFLSHVRQELGLDNTDDRSASKRSLKCGMVRRIIDEYENKCYVDKSKTVVVGSHIFEVVENLKTKSADSVKAQPASEAPESGFVPVPVDSRRMAADKSVFLKIAADNFREEKSQLLKSGPSLLASVYAELFPSEKPKGGTPTVLDCFRAIKLPPKDFFAKTKDHIVNSLSRYKQNEKERIGDFVQTFIDHCQDKDESVVVRLLDDLKTHLSSLNIQISSTLSNLLEDTLGQKRESHLAKRLAEALEGVFRPVDCADFTDGERDKILEMAKSILSDEGMASCHNEADFVQKLLSSFGDLKLRGGLKISEAQAHQALCRALVEFAVNLKSPCRFHPEMVGGTFTEKESYVFDARVGEREERLTSVFEPAPPREFMDEDGRETNPIVNLGLSSLKKDDETLVSFVRFGQVNAPLVEHQCGDNERRHYTEIAKLLLKNNKELLQKAKNGEPVDLPIYRLDMSGLKEPRLALPKEPYELTFEIDGTRVTVQARVRCIHAPMDAGSLSDARHTKPALMALLDEASERLKTLQEGDARRAKISILYKSLKEAYEKDYGEDGLGSPSDPDYKASQWLRFGSQVVMLASLLGHTPAINCNMGRDRTGAMDSEIKLLACKLTRENVKLDINEDAGTDAEERTIFLNKTGNNAMAYRMNGNTAPINLAQSYDNLRKCYYSPGDGEHSVL